LRPRHLPFGRFFMPASGPLLAGPDRRRDLFFFYFCLFFAQPLSVKQLKVMPFPFPFCANFQFFGRIEKLTPTARPSH